jgi:hypothetical protein
MDLASDALNFFYFRLRTPRLRPLASLLPWRKSRSLTRRFALKLEPGRCEIIPLRNRTVSVRCAAGNLWITHDGDPKDVVLAPQQVHRPDREGPMRLHAMDAAVVEIEFEDDAD